MNFTNRRDIKIKELSKISIFKSNFMPSETKNDINNISLMLQILSDNFLADL